MCLCFCVKLYLLLWKSGVHSIRHNLPKTIFDIFVPVAFFLLMTVSRADYEQPTKRPLPVSCFFDESFFTPPYGPRLSPAVAYSPNNSVFDEIVNKIARRYDNDTKITYIGVDTAENLENLLMQNSTIIAGIQFNHPDNITAIPDNFNFSLRFPAMMRWYNKPWPTDVLYREQAFRRYPQETLDWDFYRKEGFLVLQCRIMNTLHAFEYSGNIIPHARTLTRTFPDYPENLNFEKIQFLFPSLVLMSFYYPYINAICRIVAEKKKQTMELMKLMGVSSVFYWLCVYLKEILLRIVTVTIVVGLMKIPIGYSKAVFENSDFFLLWQFFVVYCVCSTSLGFLLSIFFTNIKPAICLSTIIWFVSFMPFSITHVDIETVPQAVLHFIPNTAMGFGVKLIFQLELMMDNGLDESTLWTGDLFPYKSLCVGTIMSIMLYTSVVFLAIFIYAVPIFPGTYGIAAPVHYLFTKDFWSKRRVDNRLREGEEDDDEDSPNFQNKPENRTPGICIRKLTKKFAKGKPAIVSNLSLNVYKNEITVLCGPNGCGKTTLLLILTGMLKATSGMALIDGYDVTQQTNLARKSMGFCPQRSIWLEGLTVREHLLFYGLIKGSKIKSAYADMKRYSKLLEFRNELNVVTSKLSQGTQRKLSIALAFCGKSQFVFLDYPSHGLDPVARQLFWNFLANERNERHILMTTNLPDEVDVTADRVAFMTNGELKFCGSTIFVRERFGAYRLVCIKDDDCKASATTRFLDQYFPDTAVETETKHHMSYLLSYQKVHKFGRFFEKLETFYKAQLKLKSFRISIATTEFLFNEFAEESMSDETLTESLEIEDDFSDGCLCRMVSIPYQLTAMFMKRFLCGIRDWRSFALYHLFVIIMMIPIVCDLYPTAPYEPNPPPLTISLDSYNNSNYCFLESDPVFDDSEHGRIRQNITDGYRRMFSSEGSLITLNATELGTYAPQLGVQKYRHNFLVGVLVRYDRYIYTNTLSALHALPISAKLYMSSRLFPARNFTVINEPLRGSTTVTDQATTEYLNMEALGMSFPIFIGILLAVILSERVIFYIKEKRHGTKMKQYVNGVNHFIFWLTSIVWDAVIGIVVVLAIVIALYISGRTFWSETETLYIVASVLFMFNLTMAPIICLLSLMFSEPATGVNTLCAINMLLCMLISVNHYGVQFIPGPILSFIPICALIECFIKLSTIQKRCLSQCGEPCDQEKREKFCEDYPVCCPQLSFLWTDEHVRRELLFMAIAGFAAFLILLVVEHEISKQLLSYAWNFILRPTSFRKNSEEESEDISKHLMNELVSEDSVGDGQQNLCFGPRKSERMEKRMTMLKVSKYYGRRLAVDEISMNLRLGECVGLIGKNGKGKTTIFKMLTGEQRICYGKAFMFGSNLKWNTRKTNDFVGYCPQSDHLWDELTVCETLRFFCLLRGTNYDRTSRLANKLNLSQHFTEKVSRLSGGSKQVLSIVIALIGYPTVILIDEATTCIDVSTRRKLWMILSKLCDVGKSILLSSDDIQEYQTVCTRFKIAESDDVSVVENEPISIEIFIESNMAEYETNNSGIVEFMKNSFKEATLRSTLDNFLTFDMPYAPNVLSKLFVAFERRKRQLCIENYFVSLK